MTKFEKILKKWLTLNSSLYEEQEYVILKCVWVTQHFKNCPEN